MSSTVERLRERLPEGMMGVEEIRGQTSIWVRANRLQEVARFLRDDPELAYDYLTDICGVDYFGQEPRFVVVYHLYSMTHGHRVRLKVPAGGEMLKVPSLVSIWGAANWLEREVYDLFGIRFDGHPNMHRILMPEGWEGHPLRKDYPLGGEKVAFSLRDGC